MVKDWKGWDAVNCLNQSVYTQFGCERAYGPSQICTNSWPENSFAVNISEPIHQSEPCITIHHTYNERLEGSSWYEMAEPACTHSIFNLGVGHRDLRSQNFHQPGHKRQDVVMVVGDEFQSQPFLTIQYTNVQRLEVLRSCELPADQSVHTQFSTHSRPENRLWYAF